MEVVSLEELPELLSGVEVVSLEELPELLVTDGCIYVAAEIKEPGIIWQKGDIFRIVYGVREKEELRPQSTASSRP